MWPMVIPEGSKTLSASSKKNAPGGFAEGSSGSPRGESSVRERDVWGDPCRQGDEVRGDYINRWLISFANQPT